MSFRSESSSEGGYGDEPGEEFEDGKNTPSVTQFQVLEQSLKEFLENSSDNQPTNRHSDDNDDQIDDDNSPRTLHLDFCDCLIAASDVHEIERIIDQRLAQHASGGPSKEDEEEPKQDEKEEPPKQELSPQQSQQLLLDLSFAGCRLTSRQALEALQYFFGKCHATHGTSNSSSSNPSSRVSVRIHHLNLSLTDLETFESAQLCAAAAPQALTLSLRYQEGVLPAILNASHGKGNKESRSKNNNDNTVNQQPWQLRALHLNAKHAHERRVRIACWNELVTALIDAGHAHQENHVVETNDEMDHPDKTTTTTTKQPDEDIAPLIASPPGLSTTAPTLSCLQNLTSFSLTDCDMSQEGLNLLVGGLLSLRNTLTTLHLQFDGHDIKQGAALVPLTHVMTELPWLQDLHLDISECPKLFLPPGEEPESGRERQNQMDGMEAETVASSPPRRNVNNNNETANDRPPPPSPKQLEQHNAMIQQFCQALQHCQAKLIRLSLANVGLTEEAVLQLFEAVARNRRGKTSSDDNHDNRQDGGGDVGDVNDDQGSISLQIRDFFFIRTERFLYQLVTLLPHCQRVRQLTLIDMAKYHVSFLCWWTDENEELLVEALESNESLESFEFQVGSVHTHVLSPENLVRVDTLLQRNRKTNRRRRLKCLSS